MAELTLIARVREDGDNPGDLVVSSPVVGRADLTLRPGVFLNGYDPVLSMLVLGRRHVLRLPRDVQGWVVHAYVGNALTPVEYGAPLLRLDPRMERAVPQDEPGSVSTDQDAEGAAGAVVVRASTEGIFYRRPSPESRAFVEVGTPVGPGTVLGLIEVMKCFNQIAYGGPGLPESGEVVRILVEDAAEVQFGTALFWIRPAVRSDPAGTP